MNLLDDINKIYFLSMVVLSYGNIFYFGINNRKYML